MANQTPKFFICETCNVLIEEVCGGKDSFSCDGTPLTELVPNTSEGAQEKHLPVIEKNGRDITVKVGSVFHPMSEEHSIQWVYLKTKMGCQRVNLSPDSEPVAHFVLAQGDEAVAAYAYCNLHGFWKTEL